MSRLLGICFSNHPSSPGVCVQALVLQTHPWAEGNELEVESVTRMDGDVCVHISVYVRMCVHTVCACARVCLCAHVCMHVRMSVHVHMCLCACMSVHMHVCTCACVCVHGIVAAGMSHGPNSEGTSRTGIPKTFGGAALRWAQGSSGPKPSRGLPTSGFSCVPSAAPNQALLPSQGAPCPLAPVPTVPSLQATLCRRGRRHPDPKADAPSADRLGDHGGRAFTGLPPHRTSAQAGHLRTGQSSPSPQTGRAVEAGQGRPSAPRSCFLPGTGERCPRAPTHSESRGLGPLPHCLSSVTVGAREAGQEPGD